MLGSSCVTERLAASQQGLSPMQLLLLLLLLLLLRGSVVG
jgi:hypothetical protein